MEANKYSRWVFTWNANLGFFGSTLPVEPLTLQNWMDKEFLSFTFQQERGEKEERLHYQGFFVTPIRVRHSTLLKKFAEAHGDIQNLTINRMCGSLEENIAYATKNDTAIEATQVTSRDLQKYDGRELEFLRKPENRHPWQACILQFILDAAEIAIKNPDDRTIIWITDTQGNSGKSKLIKYLCYNYDDIIKVPFGTATQLRASLISAGAKKVYLVDMPRTMGDDDSIPSLIASIEDLKNGFLVSSMYGKTAKLMMEPPHIIIFSNALCPQQSLSTDRWHRYMLKNLHLHRLEN